MTAVLAACAAVLLHASAPEAGVCTCAGPRTDAEAVRHSTVVFEGRPVWSHRALRFYGEYSHWVRVYTFSVERWRKGGRRSFVQVETGLGGGDCGMVFQRGRTYTVYAGHDDEGRLHTDICSGPYRPPEEPPRTHPDR